MTVTETTSDASTVVGEPDIDIRELRVYRGPNYYSYEPADPHGGRHRPAGGVARPTPCPASPSR